MAEPWKKCTECRTDIAYGAAYYQCSVSTCNRARMPLVFCSVICWDSHLSSVRHRDAGAIEAKAPTKAQWAKLSRSWRRQLDERIAELERLRDDLTTCIGCGCLSLQTCKLFNPDDEAAANGAGPRYLLGDDRDEVAGHQV